MENQHGILLVEDDPLDLDLTLRELKKLSVGWRIDVARDGEEALDFVYFRGMYANRSPRVLPKLILLDLKLPKVGGLEVLREIKSRRETRPIPVVALTSSSEERDRRDSYQLGVNSYLQKPVNFERFRQTIRTMGTYWLELNQPPPDKAFG